MATTAGNVAPADVAELEAAGPAHVATVSFLASRAVPSGGFWIALAGGVALARIAQRQGARRGYGASWAAVLETVAIMGPARFSVPFTQALSAPMLGAMEAARRAAWLQVLACAAVRIASNAVGLAFFVLVIAGGFDAYAGTYDNLVGLVGLHLSPAGTVVVSIAGLIVWGAFASLVQVGFYRRGLEGWPDTGAEGDTAPEPVVAVRRRFDPRAVCVAAAIAFALLLADRSWALLAAVALWLALATATARPDLSVFPTGFALAGVLAFGAAVFSLGGGLGVEEAASRALRAVLLVLTATWLRAAAGAPGVREVSRRGLRRLRAIPTAREAAATLEAIGSEGRLTAAGRTLLVAVGETPMKPVPMMDAVLSWVTAEAGRFRPGVPAGAVALRAGAVDVLLVLVALAPLAALLA